MLQCNDLPDRFEAEELLPCLLAEGVPEQKRSYQPSLGLLLKLRAGLRRILKRERFIITEDSRLPSESACLWVLWESFSAASALELGWSPESLHTAANSLASRCLTLSGKIQIKLNVHPLLPPVNEGKIVFYERLLQTIVAYHAELERPEGTFEDEESKALARSAMSFSREICPVCGKRRQLYCGDCGGVRMPVAEMGDVFPPRVLLPFDILLLVHWFVTLRSAYDITFLKILYYHFRHETLHKCTGIHAAALCQEGSVEHFLWTKDEYTSSGFPVNPAWGPLVASLDADRDIVLFPSDDAVLPSDVDWFCMLKQSVGERCHRLRLVVLEATWMHGSSMYRQLCMYRAERGLTPLRCIKLENVVGKYWRFHEEGHSALSTIEAIAHTAAAAGIDSDTFEKLLHLFKIQKGRVLLNVDSGARKPRALCVGGEGDNKWSDVPVVPEPTYKL